MNLQNLTEFLNTLPAKGIPGCDVTVHRDHKEIYRHTVGVKDTDTGARHDGSELYFMYSCTKVVTCVAALQLFEQGKFLMRDPISTVLPEFADVRVREGAYTVPAKSPITFKHLFTMTAGLNYNLTSAYLQEVVDRTGGRAPTRETIAAMAKMPLDFHPGEKFQYSLCHDVLAAAVEVMSGMKFGEYVKKNIFDPCGMKDSTFILTDAVKQHPTLTVSFQGFGNILQCTACLCGIFTGDNETGFSQLCQFLCAGPDTACAGQQFYGHKRIEIHVRSSLVF